MGLGPAAEHNGGPEAKDGGVGVGPAAERNRGPEAEVDGVGVHTAAVDTAAECVGGVLGGHYG